MIALLIIIYIVLGMVLILADDMTIQMTAKGVLKNDFTFTLAVIFWPVVLIYTKLKWRKTLGG